MSESIHPQTSIGTVSLAVADLERSLGFYEDVIGLQRHRQEGNTAYLGAGGPDLLQLTEKPGARPVAGTTGLYHFAILVPSRRHLAQSLRRLLETNTLGGFSDHLVSEALYLSDPDGNGIEIYRDRPRATWSYREGRLQMATDPLDVHNLMAEVAGEDAPWQGLAPGTTIGHIHLQVAHIGQAEAFYSDVLGFDLTTRYGTAASFLSAGGYHHHIGINTWESQGAPPPPADATGLRWYTIQLPTQEALDAVVARLWQAHISPEQRDEGIYVEDPAQNGIVLTHATPPA
jgi:catechol 2,3-dioxygenase